MWDVERPPLLAIGIGSLTSRLCHACPAPWLCLIVLELYQANPFAGVFLPLQPGSEACCLTTTTVQ